MRILALYNAHNMPGRQDATGAFIPESINFAKFHQANGHTVERVGYDNLLVPKQLRRERFLALIERAAPFDAFVYFGHGLRSSLPSPSVDAAHVPQLAKLLASKAADPKKFIVVLYACSTGETPSALARVHALENGEGGFADKLRDELLAAGVTGGWVDGHTIAAHTTQNAYLRRFLLDPAVKDFGGDWLVAPKSPAWARWRERLHTPWREDPFRFEFPFMDAAAVRAACLAPKKKEA